MDILKFDENINALLLGLPQGLSAAVRERVTFYKTKQPTFSPDEIYREAQNILRLEMLAYLDRRKYLGMYNRQWAEHKIREYIRLIVEKESHEEKDVYSLARVNFDLNGLKALNDLGGHEAGNKGLKLFANILNFGATTLWLRDELKLEVITSAEGGDEFGLVVHGNIDLRQYTAKITHNYSTEIYASDVSHLIDFSISEVRDNLQLLNIADEIPKGFKFRMSTSVGLCLLGEAINKVDVNRMGVTFEEMSVDISNVMFALADKRSQIHKSKFKRELSDTNPILSGLYARMSKEVIHLERELKAARERIRELEAKLKT